MEGASRYDVATVLWPAGYLLSLWAADAGQRSRWARGGRTARVLELGTGIGAAAVAAAVGGGASGPRVSVLATDRDPRSLALATANAALAGDADVRVLRFDWDDDDAVDEISAQGPFDLIMGAALLFEKWEARMWTVLERLTRPPNSAPGSAPDSAPDSAPAASCAEGEEGEAGDGVLIALAHTTAGIGTPPATFAEVGRLPGAPRYGMTTRWGAESDFEVVLLRRR